MILQKIRRKILKPLNQKKYPITPRRNFSFEVFRNEISLENTLNMFQSSPFIISYDDISFMNGEYGTRNYGGNINDQFMKEFDQFNTSNQDLKTTLFFVPSPLYIKASDFGSTLKKEYFSISHNEHHPLIEKLTSPLFEVALHGYHHVRSRPLDYFSAFEFDFVTPEKAEQLLLLGKEKLSKHFEIKGFKPPAWSTGHLNSSFSLVKALAKVEFDYVCLSSPSNGLNWDTKRCSHLYPTIINKSLFSIPQNLSILWSLEQLKEASDIILSKKGILNIQLHFVESFKYLKDGIDEFNLNKLSDLISYLKTRDHIPSFHKDIKNQCKDLKSLPFIQI